MLEQSRPNVSTTSVAAGLITIYVIWGTTYLVMKIALETLPPFAIAGIRFVIAGLLAYAGTRYLLRVPAPTLRQLGNASFIGLLLVVGGNGLVMWSIQYIPSGVAAVLVATMPIWMAVFDRIFFKGGKLSKRVISGLVIGFMGVLLLINPFRDQQNNPDFDITSAFVCMLAPICWSFGSLYSREADLPENVFMSAALQMLCGGAILLLISFFQGEIQKLSIPDISSRSIFAVAYLSVFGSIIALGTYMWLLRNVVASIASTYTYINPVIAVTLGWLLLDETVTALMIFAVAVVVAAVILIVYRPAIEYEDENLASDSGG